jgi:hypothetical protein
LNPYGLLRQILSLVRLPISPLPQAFLCNSLAAFRFLPLGVVTDLVASCSDDAIGLSKTASGCFRAFRRELRRLHRLLNCTVSEERRDSLNVYGSWF